MADIKDKNELKRRTDLFIDEFSHEEYMINEPFCKETMRMMREFIGHASHLLDCAYAKIEKAKKKARAKAIDDFAEAITNRADEESFLVTLPDGLRADVVTTDFIGDLVLEIMEELKGGE